MQTAAGGRRSSRLRVLGVGLSETQRLCCGARKSGVDVGTVMDAHEASKSCQREHEYKARGCTDMIVVVLTTRF